MTEHCTCLQRDMALPLSIPCTCCFRALEIATTIYPKSFLLLAGAGTLAKSVGKGMGKPAFRVIQQHFAIGNNVGDVAAKEEVMPTLTKVNEWQHNVFC